VGPWTAEMFLIFVLHRPDVFSMGDVGLRNAVNRLYAGGQKLDAKATRQITERWSPWRSIGSWYLWRLTDGEVGTWQ
ncbi:MAG: DNA-3-methyladenine glycosylase 2 family protein, partial [Acidovorax sp.]|nr:DNA-3-methyladenine glycosylase 2 family protein [Acidovorax sp.]